MEIVFVVQFGKRLRRGLLSATLSVTVLKVRLYFVI